MAQQSDVQLSPEEKFYRDGREISKIFLTKKERREARARTRHGPRLFHPESDEEVETFPEGKGQLQEGPINPPKAKKAKKKKKKEKTTPNRSRAEKLALPPSSRELPVDWKDWTWTAAYYGKRSPLLPRSRDRLIALERAYEGNGNFWKLYREELRIRGYTERARELNQRLPRWEPSVEELWSVVKYMSPNPAQEEELKRLDAIVGSNELATRRDLNSAIEADSFFGTDRLEFLTRHNDILIKNARDKALGLDEDYANIGKNEEPESPSDRAEDSSEPEAPVDEPAESRPAPPEKPEKPEKKAVRISTDNNYYRFLQNIMTVLKPLTADGSTQAMKRVLANCLAKASWVTHLTSDDPELVLGAGGTMYCVGPVPQMTKTVLFFDLELDPECLEHLWSKKLLTANHEIGLFDMREESLNPIRVPPLLHEGSGRRVSPDLMSRKTISGTVTIDKTVQLVKFWSDNHSGDYTWFNYHTSVVHASADAVSVANESHLSSIDSPFPVSDRVSFLTKARRFGFPAPVAEAVYSLVTGSASALASLWQFLVSLLSKLAMKQLPPRPDLEFLDGHQLPGDVIDESCWQPISPLAIPDHAVLIRGEDWDFSGCYIWLRPNKPKFCRWNGKVLPVDPYREGDRFYLIPAKSFGSTSFLEFLAVYDTLRFMLRKAIRAVRFYRGALKSVYDWTIGYMTRFSQFLDFNLDSPPETLEYGSLIPPQVVEEGTPIMSSAILKINGNTLVDCEGLKVVSEAGLVTGRRPVRKYPTREAYEESKRPEVPDTIVYMRGHRVLYTPESYSTMVFAAAVRQSRILRPIRPKGRMALARFREQLENQIGEFETCPSKIDVFSKLSIRKALTENMSRSKALFHERMFQCRKEKHGQGSVEPKHETLVAPKPRPYFAESPDYFFETMPGVQSLKKSLRTFRFQRPSNRRWLNLTMATDFNQLKKSQWFSESFDSEEVSVIVTGDDSYILDNGEAICPDIAACDQSVRGPFFYDLLLPLLIRCGVDNVDDYKRAWEGDCFSLFPTRAKEQHNKTGITWTSLLTSLSAMAVIATAWMDGTGPIENDIELVSEDFGMEWTGLERVPWYAGEFTKGYFAPAKEAPLPFYWVRCPYTIFKMCKVFRSRGKRFNTARRYQEQLSTLKNEVKDPLVKSIFDADFTGDFVEPYFQSAWHRSQYQDEDLSIYEVEGGWYYGHHDLEINCCDGPGFQFLDSVTLDRLWILAGGMIPEQEHYEAGAKLVDRALCILQEVDNHIQNGAQPGALDM